MARKIIYVACGGAVATSTVAANKVKELLKDKGIDAEVNQCRISELNSYKDTADAFVTTAKVSKDYGIPVIHGAPFITGIKQEQAEEALLQALTEE
ncbi:PTS galactitol transporter subunit IIB [Suicoccus acidiformans]|uniref:PTS galactitol transporter subunit IIB n=1 Tax=Suicoccus acidiformans TaxID=2036206 RepID=A0A347WIS1_9LACT|nr:PTS galactitol transporter subunit IIB [Suicoccus acidiformans]AXY24978.1 PTS galactitol transporter subunit IIB [Suicoccus acidiformans]